jgi:hypothetical protein
MLEQFPFEILGLHADNGSEYVNHRVAKISATIEAERPAVCYSDQFTSAPRAQCAITRLPVGKKTVARLSYSDVVPAESSMTAHRGFPPGRSPACPELVEGRE